jgi:hypothetical protein
LAGLSGVQEWHETDRVLGGRKQAYTPHYPGISDILNRGLGFLGDNAWAEFIVIALAIALWHITQCKKKKRPRGSLALKNVTVI